MHWTKTHPLKTKNLKFSQLLEIHFESIWELYILIKVSSEI